MIQIWSPDAEKAMVDLSKVDPLVRRELADALRGQAELVATEAKLRCPVLHGYLRNSIHAEKPIVDEDMASVSVVAGEGLPYARRQHEDETLRHTVGEAKFLENAGRLQEPAVKRAVQAAIKKGIEEAHG